MLISFKFIKNDQNHKLLILVLLMKFFVQLLACRKFVFVCFPTLRYAFRDFL